MCIQTKIRILMFCILAIYVDKSVAQDDYINTTQMENVNGITAKAYAGLSNSKLINPTSAQLQNMKVLVAPGVVYDAQKYVLATRLNQRAELTPLFSPRFQRQHLKTNAKYDEIVEVQDNELIVQRTLVLEPKNPCSAALQKVLNLCFAKRGNTASKSVEADLNRIRRKLRRTQGQAGINPNLRQELLAKSDADLLNYLLNTQSKTKKVTHRSVLPMVAYQYKYDLSNASANKQRKPIASTIELRSQVDRLKHTSLSDSARLKQNKKQNPQRISSNPKRLPGGEPLTFSHKTAFSKKFLPGFTFGREFGDTYRVQFAPETWFTDEYYAQFTYHVSAGFGLRFPLELRGTSSIAKVYAGQTNFTTSYPARQLCSAARGNPELAFYCAKTSEVSLRVVPFDANEDEYLEMGVDETQLFHGKELIFEIGARCNLYASIPGKDISKRCPSNLKGIDFGRNFVPQIGRTPRTLFKKTIPGRPLGIALETGIGYAALNPGVALQAIDGRLVFDVGSHRSEVSSNLLELNDRVQKIEVTENVRRGRATHFGFDLNKPRYRVNTRLVPLMEIEIGIDLGILGWDHSYGPYELDDLAIELAEFEFAAHEGTADKLKVRKVGTRANLN